MKNDLENRIFALAANRTTGSLRRPQEGMILGRQLLKSGTSIGKNYREASRAESHDDFIHKVATCEKEAAETEYWIELLIEAGIEKREQTNGCWRRLESFWPSLSPAAEWRNHGVARTFRDRRQIHE